MEGVERATVEEPQLVSCPLCSDDDLIEVDGNVVCQGCESVFTARGIAALSHGEHTHASPFEEMEDR